MALTTVTLNPGAGGASVITDQQSTGAQMPISELAVSVSGVADATAVSGANPLPTKDVSLSMGQAEAIIARLDAILWVLMEQSGKSPAANHPAFLPAC